MSGHVGSHLPVGLTSSRVSDFGFSGCCGPPRGEAARDPQIWTVGCLSAIPVRGGARALLLVMEVIVRPQDRALCASITCYTDILHPHTPTLPHITPTLPMRRCYI